MLIDYNKKDSIIKENTHTYRLYDKLYTVFGYTVKINNDLKYLYKPGNVELCITMKATEDNVSKRKNSLGNTLTKPSFTIIIESKHTFDKVKKELMTLLYNPTYDQTEIQSQY